MTETTEHERRVLAAVFACASEDCPRPFALYRDHDATGVSGTGTVAHGVRFADGLVVIRWLGETPSMVVWGSLGDAMKVHGHDGKTRVVWLAAPFSEMGKAEEEAAEAERKRITALARQMGATYLAPCDEDGHERILHTHHRRPFAGYLEDAGSAP